MSAAYNRRRGARANKPRKVRTCQVQMEVSRIPGPACTFIESKPCGAAVQPDRNGNYCEEHRV